MSQAARPRSSWNASCDVILLDALFSERSGGRQTANGNFHTAAWTAAEALLAGTEVHSGGAVKTAASCQTRWATVSPISCLINSIVLTQGLFINSSRRTTRTSKLSSISLALVGTI
jgi:hypothetical protein